MSIDDSATNSTDSSDLDGIPSIIGSDYDEEEDNLNSVLYPHYLRYVTSAVYSYCGTEILASYSEDDIYLFDANGRSNSILHNYGGHINRITGI